MLRKQNTRDRDGAALVEFALVAMIFFIILFSIFEFAYLVMVKNLMSNAVREGARYACVNTNAGSALTDQIRDVVDARMQSIKGRLSGYDKNSSITIRAVNPITGNQLTSGGGNVNIWDTSFGEFIEVRISATYIPIMPSLVRLPASLTLSANAITNSEAN